MTESVAGFSVGSRAEFEHQICAEDVKRFVELTGDDNPLHVNHEFAERTSFKGVVAHGMLSASYISTVIGKHIPGNGALWLSQSTEFLLPVRIGDRLRVIAEVTSVQVSQRILVLRTEIRNQHDQIVLKGDSRVRVLEIAAETAKQVNERATRAVVIVTGASRGIGAETARRLAMDGYSVIVNYRDDEESALRVVADIAHADGRAMAIRADICRERAARQLVEEAVAAYGGLSALVHCAATPLLPKPLEALVEKDLMTEIEMHVLSPFRLVQLAVPYLKQSDNASVVTVGSVATDTVPPPQMLAYATAKAALAAMTRAMASELGPQQIRFNMVTPGMTETRLIGNVPERTKLLTRMQTPLRRLADVGDIANGIAFLLSPGAKHITGETLRICGGVVMR